MADSQPDAEIRALEVLFGALEPLDDDARGRVLDYTLKRLGMRQLPSIADEVASPRASAASHTPELGVSTRTDIRTLREQKSPSTAVEMAALVAYYVAEAAPEGERKDSVTTADIERLFKQAGYPLPTRIDTTLSNAAAAGYFDKAGRGAYRLNPVGFNLVTQSLPRGSAGVAPRKRAAAKPRARPAARAPRKTQPKKRK